MSMSIEKKGKNGNDRVVSLEGVPTHLKLLSYRHK